MLVLASKSASRRAMLEAAGVSFRCEAADVDERGIESTLSARAPADVALALAEAKALSVGGDLVLGSDSLVAVEGQRFDKPATREEAAAHLRFFSGRVMELHSAAALSEGRIVWSYSDCAFLHMRDLSEAFITSYLDAEWPEIGHCAGAFRIEAMGVQLFERIEGNHFTVLGMPLLPVLSALRQRGAIAA